MRKALAGAVMTLLLAATAQAWDLQIWNEFARFTPDGQMIKQDWTSPPPEPLNTITRPHRLQAIRNGYISLVVLVKDDKGGPYKLKVTQQDGPAVRLDLYRAWFHFSPKKPETPPGQKPKPWLQYVPDALIPTASGAPMTLPAADNRIPNQKAQMFWVDVFVPRDAEPGKQVTIKVTLSTKGYNCEAYAILDTQWLAYPDEEPITADHNRLRRQLPRPPVSPASQEGRRRLVDQQRAVRPAPGLLQDSLRTPGRFPQPRLQPQWRRL